MNAIECMVRPVAVPQWRGECRIHVLRDEPLGRPAKPRILAPWTLIRPGTREESLMRATPSWLYWQFPEEQ